MPIYNEEDIIAWENSDGKVVCVECYDKDPENFKDYTPIEKDNSVYENKIIFCDECEKRIT
jgi:hypothetical protein